MPFQVSPGVNVSEVDLTTTTPAAAVSVGALVGQFAKGPVGEIVTVSSETELAQVFGKPTDQNYRSFYTAANFLSYAGNLQVSRVVGSGTLNAVAGVPTTSTPTLATETGTAVAAISGETFTGNGADTTFTLSRVTYDETLTVTVDGTATTDFTVDGTTLTFGSAPTGTILVAVSYTHLRAHET